MYGRTYGQRENSIPTTNKVCGGGGGMITFYFNIFLFYPLTLNIICLVDKNIFEVLSVYFLRVNC